MKIERLFRASAGGWSAPFPTSDSSETLVLAFGPPELLAPLSEVRAAFSKSHVVGCSSVAPLADGATGLDVTVLRFEHSTLATATAKVGEGVDAHTVGKNLARKLSKPSLAGLLVLADSQTVDGAELLRGINSAVDRSVTVFGGVSGASDDRSASWLLSGSVLAPGHVVMVGFYGAHLAFGHATESAWTSLGVERKITRADGRRIFELDGAPASEVYKECLAAAGAAGDGLPVSFALRATARHTHSLVRSVVAVEDDKRAIRLSLDVPQGYLAQAVVTSTDARAAAAGKLAKDLLTTPPTPGSVSFAFAVGYAARAADVASPRAEAAAIRRALPSGNDFASLYGLGEIGARDDAHSELHNGSLALTIVTESATPVARKAARGIAASATRAQAPATAAGPAAHLRTRQATVDDLFAEIEIERRGKAGAPIAAPPPPPVRRRSGEHRGLDGHPTPPAMPAVVPPGSRPSARPSDVGMLVRPLTFDPKTESWSGAAATDIATGRSFILAFGPPQARGAIAGLLRAFPTAPIVGCSSERSLGRGNPPGEAPRATLVTFAKTTVGVVHSAPDASPTFVATKVASSLMSTPGLRAVLLFSANAVPVDEQALVRGLTGALPATVAIVGASNVVAGGWLVAGGALADAGVVALGLYGDHVRFGVTMRETFAPFGPERRVTRAARGVIEELDGKPAASLYVDQLGAFDAQQSLRFPLAVRAPGAASHVLHLPLSVDPEAKSLRFATDIAEGSLVRLMRAEQERLLDDAGDALAGAAVGGADGPGLALLVASVSRLASLGPRESEQVDAALEGVPKSTSAQVIGLYARTEISRSSGEASTNSGTLVAALISEGEARAVAVPSAPAVAAASAASTSRRPAAPLSVLETPSAPQVARAHPPPSASPPSSAAPPRSVAPASRSGAKLITRPLQTGGANEATMTRTRVGDITVVAIAGRLSEAFKGDQAGRELSGIVVFDLARVERITSFGVREWLQMMATASERVKQFYFARCSEPIVNQLGMIRKFAGSGHVVSFFGPHLCDACGEQFERLFDLEFDADLIRNGAVPQVACPQCAGRANFDDDPTTFFSFSGPHVGLPVPQPVRDVIDGLESAPGAPAEAVEKVIEGTTTRIRIQQKGAGTIRWQRILEGSEGTVIVDFGGVFSLDPTSVAALEQSLASLSPEVDAVRLERAPQAVIEWFAAQGLPTRVSVTSTVLAAHCDACGVQRPALLVTDDHLPAITAGREPALLCRRCNGQLKLTQPQTVLALLAKQRRARLSVTPPPRDSVIPSAPQSAPPAPSVAPAVPAPVASSTRSNVALVLAFAAVIATAGVAVVALRRAPPPVTSAAGQPASGWTPALDVPPAWVDRAVAVEGDSVAVVGRSERAQSPEAAVQQTRQDAISRLVVHLSGELGGTPSRDVVGTLRAEDLVSRAAAVADLYTRQTGAAGQLDRGETIVRPREGGVEAFARYRIPVAAYNEVVAAYRRTANLHGLVLARAFPGLDFAGAEGDTMVVTVPRNMPMQDRIEPGDVVVAANGRPFAFGDYIKSGDEWFGVAPGGTLAVELHRRRVKLTFSVKRPLVAAVVAAAPPRAPAPPPAVVAPPVPARDSTPPATRYKEVAPPTTTYREGAAVPKDRDPPITTYKRIL